MKIFEIGTGYTSIPAQMGAATEIVAEELAKAYLNMGYNVTILDIKNKNRAKTDLPIEEVPMLQFFAGTDTKLGVVHKLKRVLYSISLAFKIQKIIKKEKKDNTLIFHFHNQYNLFFFLKLTSKRIRKRACIAYTVHSYIWQGDWEAIEETVHKRYFQEIYSCRNADQVFVLNEPTARHFITNLGILPAKVHPIANGVNTSAYFPMSAEERLETKRKLGLEGKIVFFQAGSVCERKNQLGALRLLLPLMESNADIVFVYAGGIISHEYKKAVDELAAFSKMGNRVRYAGELTPGASLNQYYNSSEAFLFPSTAEGFSLVILEAMSAGIPVLVDANAGLQLPGHEEAGCLRYVDSNDFALKIDNLLSPDLGKRMGLAARRCIEQNYSWDSVALKYAKSFNGKTSI